MNNSDNYFPELNIPFLKLFVKNHMLKSFAALSLKKLTLFRYNLKHYRHYECLSKKLGKPKTPKYLLAFESDVDQDKLTDKQKRKIKSLYRSDTCFLEAEDMEKDETSIEKIRIQTMPVEIDFSPWDMDDDAFADVYKNKPPEGNYLEEWKCLLISLNKKKPVENKEQELPYSEMPPWVRVDTPHVTLYDSSENKDQGQHEKKKKKLRPCQKDRLEVREIAKDIIKKEPNITKIDLSRRRELIDATSKQYKEKTIYGWIKDLLPDRKAGRPPKKSLAVKSQKQAGQKYKFKGHTFTKIVSNK
ncbi:MAG: hypothetical protein JRG68_04760 [Deltaproteobacteria bacterium]|nr:hypothetical protein [Deltaproteobacteria bacterium]MBW1759566.1 hypothetical protein [Deltaproteobacteria bacterium]MBW1939573.1 hypothetical protein [Deltaproteobacteria bacterium]MBW2100066.1 hypothetical protein [Deltaproteobacteria bacterium]MBW2350724.1 hypothetical protein [Deltaproteobacteria bacterium]